MCGKLALAYDRTENVLYLVLAEKIVRGRLLHAIFVTSFYHHIIEISQ